LSLAGHIRLIYCIHVKLNWCTRGRYDTQHNDIQHNIKFNATLSIMALSIMTLSIIAGRCYAECCYANNPFIQRAIMLSVVAPSKSKLLTHPCKWTKLKVFSRDKSSSFLPADIPRLKYTKEINKTKQSDFINK
jgi:hypothetical protein